MANYTKIRKIQEMNEKLEKKYLQERLSKKGMINEGIFDRVASAAMGFFNRFRTFGQNIGAVFTGGFMLNPSMEAAYTRIRTRANTLQKELTELENDVKILFDESDKMKIQKRIDKKSDPQGKAQLEERLVNLENALTKYVEAIQQMKGANEGIINSVAKA